MKERFKQLGRDSLVYGLGGVVAKSIGFFLLPIYTRIFSPADYGTIEMLTVLAGFLSMFLQLGMDSAQSFYFFEQKNNGQSAQSSVVSAIVQWRILWGTVIVICATLLSPLLNYFFFQGNLTWEYFAIAFVGVLFSQLVSQSAEVFRLLYKPWRFIGITLGNAVVSSVVALILILKLGFGIKGYLAGFLVGSLISTGLGWFYIREFLDFSKLHKDWWPRLLKFGAPLVPSGLAIYVLNTSDRWFVSHYAGQEALGLYAVGAKFAMVIALAVTTFRQAWWPIAMDSMHGDDGPVLFRTIGRLYLGCGVACVVLLTAISPYLVRWLTPPEYYGAYPLIGVLAWYSVFYGFYLIGAGGIWKAEKTAVLPLLAGTAAVLNVILDAILVPSMGGMGAAVATSISFLVWNVLVLAISEKLWKVGYPFGRMVLQVALGGGATGYILFSYSQKAVFVQVGPLAGFVIFLVLMISVPKKQLVAAWGSARSFVGRR
jgi:O-antigen/teichoic acid export membrane protein